MKQSLSESTNRRKIETTNPRKMETLSEPRSQKCEEEDIHNTLKKEEEDSEKIELRE